MPPKTPDDLREKVLALAKAGKTRNAIREQTGLSLDTIRSILFEAGVMTRPLSRYNKALDDVLTEKVLRLHTEGTSMAVISAVTGLSNQQIAKIIRASEPIEITDPREVGPREFIQAWQQSDSLDEVAMALKMPISRVKARAAMYRSRGVPLKNYRKGARYDWDDLSNFAESLLQGDEGDED